MKNLKNNAWSIIAGIIFVGTVLLTAGLLVKVAGLDMLPTKYLAIAAIAIVVVLAGIFACFFLLPWKKKEESTEAATEVATEEVAEEQKKQKKAVAKYVLRSIAMILAVALVVVDVVGIQMVNKFEETMSNVTDGNGNEGDNNAPKVEEFIISVYVRAEDKAENLEDAKRYDFGYSLSYDGDNIEKAINVMENELDRKLELEEYENISPMIDAVLANEKDAFIISEDYFEVLESQEGYEGIDSKIKCIHTCVVTVELEVSEKEETPLVITKDTFIVYLSGFDTTRNVKRANSDVNILAVVNPTTKQVLLINTPRDYYVPITASKDGTRDKLTHCGIYGVDCSMDTLNDFYDIDISYYAQINFKGFVRLIDAIGGITVYSEKDFATTNEGIAFKKGDNHVNGEQALAFVRERKQFGDGDHARGRHQMAVIKAIIKKMSSGSLLKNYDDVLDSMGKSFRCSFGQEDITSLVKMQLGDMAEWNVQSFAVVGTGKNSTTYTIPNKKLYVMIPDEASVEHAKKLIQMVYDGETIEKDDLKYKK